MAAPQIKQFKLTNEDEIICEVLEWDNEHDASIVIRSALKLIQGVDPDTKVRFFAFRPWFGFQDDPELMQTLNSGHIIGEANPTDRLISHYLETIKEQLDNVHNQNPDLPEETSESVSEEGNVITFPKTFH